MSFPYTQCVLCLLLIESIVSCGSRAESNHPVYDLDHPKRISLPPELDEISGLSYDPTDSGLFAIEDEIGIVYKLFPEGNHPTISWNLSGKGDFEDVALLNSQLWLLRSDGKLTAFQLPLSSGMQISAEAKLDEKGNEFESLMPDFNQNALTLVCKHCREDKKGRIGARVFQIDRNEFSASDFYSPEKERPEKDSYSKTRINPTAAVRDTFRNLILVLASNPSQLLELSPDYTLSTTYNLDPSIYNQPEGIALSSDGTLFISTERGDKSSAELFVIHPNLKAVRR